MLRNKAPIGIYTMLHILVIIYGFTPVLGKLISIAALPLVWWRLVFSLVLLYFYLLYRKFKLRSDIRPMLMFAGTGVIVGVHWASFYHSIKVSNINTAMCGFATMTLFTALFEPFFFKRRISALEVILGFTTLIGLIIISYSAEVQLAGIIYGVIAAITAALFVNLNSLFSRKYHPYSITFYEFAGALIAVSVISLFLSQPAWIKIHPADIFWLFILSLACTVFPFIEATKISKSINPFTMVLVNNLEPVYGIMLAFVFFSNTEVMNLQFYIGAAFIISGIFVYPYIKFRGKMGEGEMGAKGQ
jgi:drug/metabolite transporter (DMT)-like permease